MDKKTEAIKRMKALGIYKPVIRQFEKEDLINQSEPPLGACYWLEDDQLERVRKFEADNNALVYHVIHCWTEFGELENYLFVSNYPEEWEMDIEDINNGQALSYVYNVDGGFADMGSIGIKLTPAAGLQRIW